MSEVKQEKDLGVIINKDLKFQHHIAESVKKANRKLGLIRRSFSCLDKEIFTNLYKSIVRPNLEYGCTIWSVIYKKEAITLENVQRRATKLVSSIRHLTYSERTFHTIYSVFVCRELYMMVSVAKQSCNG